MVLSQKDFNSKRCLLEKLDLIGDLGTRKRKRGIFVSIFDFCSGLEYCWCFVFVNGRYGDDNEGSREVKKCS